jgi:hypothetical protein
VSSWPATWRAAAGPEDQVMLRGKGGVGPGLAGISGGWVHRFHTTGLRCTILHRFWVTAIFYPIFYPNG